MSTFTRRPRGVKPDRPPPPAPPTPSARLSRGTTWLVFRKGPARCDVWRRVYSGSIESEARNVYAQHSALMRYKPGHLLLVSPDGRPVLSYYRAVANKPRPHANKPA
jgi:hypothetical protein